MVINRVPLGNIKGIDGQPGADGRDGERGYDGTKLNVRGDWVSGILYSCDIHNIDIVNFSGTIYYCKKTNSRTVSPDIDTEYWGIFLESPKRLVEHFTINDTDGSFEYDAGYRQIGYATPNYRIEKPSNMPENKSAFIQAKIPTDASGTCGIFFKEIKDGKAVFYFDQIYSPESFPVVLWLDDVNMIEYEEEQVPTTRYNVIMIDVGLTNSAYPSIRFRRNQEAIGWGDGFSSFGAAGHNYETDAGECKVRILMSSSNDLEMYEGYTDKEIITSVSINHACKIRFAGCTNLRQVNINSSGTYSEVLDWEGAFLGCENLSVLNLPSGITIIPADLCTGCSELKSLALPSSVTRIEENAFAGSGLENMNMINAITYIGESAFEGAGIVYLPSSLTKLGDRAFYGSQYNGRVTIPSSLEQDYGHRDQWFSNSKITGVTFAEPSQITVATGFDGCENLAGLTLPTSVTRIEDDCFNGCRSLGGITFGTHVRYIGEHAFYSTGVTIDFNGTMAQFNDIEKDYFWWVGVSKVVCTDGTITI